MSFSWVCCLLPLVFVLASGEPPQGEEPQFRHPPPPPSRQQIAAALQASHGIWAKQRKAMHDQAVKAHDLFLEHLSKKHNTNYQKAPGEVTHIMVENTMGRIYHMNSVVVKAECPENQVEGDPKKCEIPLDAKKWECKGEVVQLYGIDTSYIHDEDCTEYKELPGSLKPSSVPTTPNEEEEGNPYV